MPRIKDGKASICSKAQKERYYENVHLFLASSGDGSRELPQLPALQVRMEEEDGVEEEEEVEEEVDHADEGTFDLDFGPLLGEILQVD